MAKKMVRGFDNLYCPHCDDSVCMRMHLFDGEIHCVECDNVIDRETITEAVDEVKKQLAALTRWDSVFAWVETMPQMCVVYLDEEAA